MRGTYIGAVLVIGTVIAACGTSTGTGGTPGGPAQDTVATMAASTIATVQTAVPTTVVSPPTTRLAQIAEPIAPTTGLVWQEVTPGGNGETMDGSTFLISGGDRFIVVDGSNVRSSFDGRRWTTVPIEGSIAGVHEFTAWNDTVVGYGCGGASNACCVSVVHPDGSVARYSFDGDVLDVGIGPAGMVAIVSNHRNEDGLRYVDEDVLAWNLTGRDINEFDVFEIRDGVLHVEFEGRQADYVLADLGYASIAEPIASAWFSFDGEAWISIPDFPLAERWSLIGTEDGFVGISEGLDGDPVVWHSSDGMDWRELGQSQGFQGLSRWNEGALVVGTEGTETVWYVSGNGIEETSLMTDENGPAFSASGDIGAVKLDIEPVTLELNQILYSPGGEEWITTNIPPDMSDRELTIDAHHLPVEAVVTDTSVMLLLNEGNTDEDESTLIWFLGTPTRD
ncbi:MAG: hypothetical protein GWP18_00290 [Proteobacteria bacterium]|nr:hypothetical protein [Pseudomonadota bacterium]